MADRALTGDARVFERFGLLVTALAVSHLRREVIHLLQRLPDLLVMAKRTLQPGHIDVPARFAVLMAADAVDRGRIRVGWGAEFSPSIGFVAV